MLLKIKLILILILFYQTPLLSKSNSFEKIDSKNLSKYFSGIVASGNQKNSEAFMNYFNSTRATYAAKTGALYIFPGWLKHSVQGNQSHTDRISMSFNFGEKTNEN